MDDAKSDLIQGLAKAYAERVVMERCLAVEDACEVGLRPMVAQIRALFAIDAIEKDLGWFCSHEVMTPKTGRRLEEFSRQLCRDIAPHALELCESFGIPDHMLPAPIANDWVGYNAFDNKGELPTKHVIGTKPRRLARSAQRQAYKLIPRRGLVPRYFLSNVKYGQDFGLSACSV